MLLGLAVCTLLLGLIYLPNTRAQFGFGDFHSEYRDIMTNCQMDGGTCFDPYAEARSNAAENEGPAPRRPAPAIKGPPGKGRNRARAAPAPPRAMPTQPPVNPWPILQENCGSWEYDFGCQRTGGFCCYPHP